MTREEIIDEAEKILEASQLEGLAIPIYEGLSIANIAPSVTEVLGIEAGRMLVPLAHLRKISADAVVVLLLDSLGLYDLLEVVGEGEECVEKFELHAITSVAPTTTATALASLYTGLAPAQHGLLGYRLYLREFGMVVKLLEFSPVVGGYEDSLRECEIPLRHLLLCPNICETLTSAGVEVCTIAHRELKDTAFVDLLASPSKRVGVVDLCDLVLAIPKLVKRARGALYIQAYWHVLDAIGHEYGPGSDEYRLYLRGLLRTIFSELGERLRNLGKRTLLVITSDHGQVVVDRGEAIRLRAGDELAKCLIAPPYGDSRFAFFLVADREGFLRESEKLLSDSFLVLESKRILELGILGRGEFSREAVERAGDFAAIPLGGGYIEYLYSEERGKEHVGRHGGLDPREVLVPLAISASW